MAELHGPTSSRAPGPNRSDANGKTPVNEVQRPQGLYDPAFEHDSCGVGFVVDMHGRASHRIIELGIASLCHLDHRGATGAEANVGDGAGILVQVPDRFLREVVDFELPPAGSYAVGCAFLPRDADECAAAMGAIDKIVASEDLVVLGWRDVPHDDSMIGQMARDAEPSFKHLFVGRGRRVARRHRPRSTHVRAAQAHRARDRAPTSRRCPVARSSTRACSSPVS